MLYSNCLRGALVFLACTLPVSSLVSTKGWNIEVCVHEGSNCDAALAFALEGVDEHAEPGPNAITDYREVDRDANAGPGGFMSFEPSIAMSRVTEQAMSQITDYEIEVFGIVRGLQGTDAPNKLHPMSDENHISAMMLYSTNDILLAIATVDIASGKMPSAANVRFVVPEIDAVRLEARSTKYGYLKGQPTMVPANALVGILKMDMGPNYYPYSTHRDAGKVPVLREVVEESGAASTTMELSLGTQAPVANVSHVFAMIENSFEPVFFQNFSGTNQEFSVLRFALPKKITEVRPYVVFDNKEMYQGPLQRSFENQASVLSRDEL